MHNHCRSQQNTEQYNKKDLHDPNISTKGSTNVIYGNWTPGYGTPNTGKKNKHALQTKQNNEPYDRKHPKQQNRKLVGKKTTEKENELGIPNITQKKTKYQQKKIVRQAITHQYKTKLENESKDKSKIKYLLEGKGAWKPGTKPKYIQKLNRTLVRTIFKARTRMLDIKNNFRGKYQGIKCRGCGMADETQEHVLEECIKLHENNENKVTKEEIFSDNPDQNTKTAEKIQYIMKQIERAVPKVVQPGDPGTHTPN